ncbi:DUF4176 domain-containing protein [Rossellomorea sp. NRS-1567]|uniref:DUF4176 domain-containing protein n=1 Tax=Rossellomorea sp. NRS-1567 TaxID=3233901 RepID=UPI003D27B676
MINEKSKLLPIGTVVKLKSVDKAVMIYGRHQIQKKTDKVFDYIAVPYPEGNLSEEFNVFFNREIIEEIIHPGLTSPAEDLMRKKVESDIEQSKSMKGTNHEN